MKLTPNPVVGTPADTFCLAADVQDALGVAVIGVLATLVWAWFHGERGEQKTSSTERLIFAV